MKYCKMYAETALCPGNICAYQRSTVMPGTTSKCASWVAIQV